MIWLRARRAPWSTSCPAPRTCRCSRAAGWAAAHKGVLERLPHRALGYPDPRGLPELRTALASLLTRRRGVVADPERIVVCSGVAQATTLLGFVLGERGERTVGVEDPGSPEHTALFAASAYGPGCCRSTRRAWRRARCTRAEYGSR